MRDDLYIDVFSKGYRLKDYTFDFFRSLQWLTTTLNLNKATLGNVFFVTILDLLMSPVICRVPVLQLMVVIWYVERTNLTDHWEKVAHGLSHNFKMCSQSWAGPWPMRCAYRAMSSYHPAVLLLIFLTQALDVRTTIEK